MKKIKRNSTSISKAISMAYNYDINSTFLYYLLKNSISKLKQMTHGSVFDTITRDTFATLIVGVPDRETQDVIAETLAAIDDKIELNNKLNDNLQQQAYAKQAVLFVELKLRIRNCAN